MPSKEHNRGSAATIEREQAFQDELRLLFPRIRVVAMQYGMADQARAERITEELLGSYAGLSGIVDSLVVQDPYRMGYETIRALAAKLAGKHPPVFVDSGVRLVLAGDVDAPDVRQLLFPTLKPGPRSLSR